MSMLEESIKNRIMYLLREINKNSFKGILQDQILISIRDNFCMKNKTRLHTLDVETEVKKYMQVVLIQNCKRNDNLGRRLLRPYFDIYDEVNSLLERKDTDEIRQEFVNICFSVLIYKYDINYGKRVLIKERYQSYLKFFKKTEEPLKERLQENKKVEFKSKKKMPIKNTLLEENKVIKKSIESEPRKKNGIISDYYSVHSEYIEEILMSLNDDERMCISDCSSISEFLGKKDILVKVDYALRYYPMLRFTCFNFLDRQERLKKFMKLEHYAKDIRIEQKSFFQNVHNNPDIVMNEILKLKTTNPSLFQIFQVFLGEIKNELSYSVLEKNVRIWIKSFENLDLSEYLFSHFFAKDEMPLAKVIVQCFKNEYPEFYDAIIQKYGNNLYEYHCLTEKLEKACKEGIQKIKDLISFEREGFIRIDETEFLIFDNKKKVDFLKDMEEFSEETILEEAKSTLEQSTKKINKPSLETENLSREISNEETSVLPKTQNILEISTEPTMVEETVDSQVSLVSTSIENMLKNLSKVEKDWLQKYMKKQVNHNSLSHKVKISDFDFLKSSLYKLRSFSPCYYEVLKEFHGDHFNEWHPSQRMDDYKKAIHYLEFFLKKDTLLLQQEERNHLKSLLKNLNGVERNLIREKRQGMDTYYLSQKYHISIHDIYLLFATNISLFGMNAPYIIKEIILNSFSGVDYLEASSSMHYILDNLSTFEMREWKKSFFDFSYVSSNLRKLREKR